jgi:4,5-dihydroxyphthalate decarboxylase
LTLRPGEDIEDLFLRKEVDALLLPTPPKLFQKRDPRIRRLFPDCVNEIRKYFNQTKIFPITHTVVMNKSVWKDKPWTATSLVDAFKTAQTHCTDFYTDFKRLSLVQTIFILEEERNLFGPDPWAHGLEINRHGLEKFVRYAREQGFITYEPKLEELFAANTLTT